MIPDLRVPRIRAAALARLALVPVIVAGVLLSACNKVPLTAPSNATIRLTANTAVVPLGGTAEVTATVIQGGGVAVHNGTLVSFTTSLGTVDPPEAETRDGRVTVTFRAGTQSGTATVNAYSGGASTTTSATTGTGTTTTTQTTTTTGGGGITFLVGAAAAALVSATASPGTVSAAGGTSVITASVFDASRNLLPGVPLSFSTDVGTITPSLAVSDANGRATATLTTFQTATVTVTAGGSGAATGGTGGTTTGGTTATVKVSVTTAPTIVITAPSTSPTATQNATFQVAVTPGGAGGTGTGNVPITKATIDFGDGTGAYNLGAATGTITVSHIFKSEGTFSVTVSVTDAAGQTTTASVPVTVFPAQPFTLTVTAGNGRVGQQISMTAIPTAGTGAPSVSSYIWDFGDNTPKVTTATPATSHVYTSIPAGFTSWTYTVQVTATGSDGRLGFGSTNVTITP